MQRCSRRLATFLSLLMATAALGAELEPKSTFAVIAGVLSWPKEAKLESFSPAHRKDQELYDTLRARGVPTGNMALLLDAKATRASVLEALHQIGAKAGKGSTLIFYFAGHGAVEDSGAVSLCTYDYGQTGAHPLVVGDIGDALQQSFHGERVLLMADCCHSGGLNAAAKSLADHGLKAASLTSADASNISTENWTFTQAVIDALTGDPLADLDGDGTITFGELAKAAQAAMKYREQQRYGFADHGFGADFKLGPAERQGRPTVTGPFPLCGYVTVKDQDRNMPGRVVGAKGGDVLVELYDYTDKRVIARPPGELKDIVFAAHKAGESVKVLWEKDVYDAKILDVQDGFSLVTYPGWDGSWNEWVPPGRIVRSKAEAKWKDQWYSAVVLDAKDDKVLVHYVDFDATWDEWVDKGRVRVHH